MKVSSSSEEFFNLRTGKSFPRSETSSTLLFRFPGLVNVLFGFNMTTGRRYFYTRLLKARQLPKDSLRTNTRQQEPLWKTDKNNL